MITSASQLVMDGKKLKKIIKGYNQLQKNLYHNHVMLLRMPKVAKFKWIDTYFNVN